MNDDKRKRTVATIFVAGVLTLAIASKYWTDERQHEGEADATGEAREMNATNHSDPGFLIDYQGPWLQLEGNSYFDFTENEWRALTRVYTPTHVDRLTTPQGELRRTSAKEIERLGRMWPGAVRTNRVWIGGPGR